MSFLQQLYIWVLNPIYKITGRTSEKTKNIILGICLFCMATQFFVFTTWEKYEIQFGYSELFIINTFFLCIVIVFSVNKPLEKVKWNPLIYIPWFLCSILILASGLHHNITGALMFFTGLMLLVFPCLFMIWNNRGDYDTLYRITSKAIVVVAFLFYIFHLLMMPLEYNTAYFGIAVNSNSIGILSTAGVIASLYLICLNSRCRWIYMISFGMSLAFAYVSLSRASIIAIGLVIITFIICYLRSCRDRNEKIIKALIIIAITLICGIVSVAGYKSFLTQVTPDIREKIQDIAVITVYAATEEQTEPQNALIQKFKKSDNLNYLTSGRTYIWKAYINELNFAGHERGDEGIYIEEMRGCFSAHNSYLEIAYRSGILAGLCYVFIAIYAAVYAFRFIFGRKRFDYRLSIIPMAVMTFGVLSNLERALYPVEKAHIFLFFIALAPMFVKMESKVKENR